MINKLTEDVIILNSCGDAYASTWCHEDHLSQMSIGLCFSSSGRREFNFMQTDIVVEQKQFRVIEIDVDDDYYQYYQSYCYWFSFLLNLALLHCLDLSSYKHLSKLFLFFLLRMSSVITVCGNAYMHREQIANLESHSKEANHSLLKQQT